MKEALKLALDLAIMHHSDDGYAELRSKVRQLAKEALAPTSTQCEVQPNLDQGPDYERGFVDGMLYQTQTSVDKAVNAMAQPEQEPVAWEQFYPDIGKPQLRQEPSITKEARGTLILHSGWDDLPNGTKFYTTPPKRPWVGLTATAKLDLLSTAKGVGGRINGDAQLLELLNEHETQLKRKNT